MLKMKPILQNDFQDCGICSMQWIIEYYDGYIPLEKLREDTYTTNLGTNAYHLVNAFIKWNFDASGVLEHDITKKYLKFPLIAHLHLRNSLEHFVVVRKVNKDNVYLMDPGKGYTKMTITEFQQLFTGHLILVHPRGKIIKIKQTITMKKLFWQILKQEKFLILIIIILSIIWSFVAIILSFYLKIGNIILDSKIIYLRKFIILFLILTFIKTFILYIRSNYENHLLKVVDNNLYHDFLKHLFYLPLKNIKSRTTGEVMARVNELQNIKSLFAELFITSSLDVLLMISSIVILSIINVKLCYILIIFLILYSIYGYIISKKIYEKLNENIDVQTNFNSVLIENINAFESIKNLNLIDYVLKKINLYLDNYLINNYQCNKLFNLTNLGSNTIIEFFIFSINTYGLYSIYKGDLNIIDLFTFNIILSYSIDIIQNIINILPKYNYVKAAFNKISEFLNIKEEYLKKNNDNLKGNIQFNNVSYSYNNYDYIIKNLNLNIKDGEHILLNGPSGSGKSTICKMLIKENIPLKGKILIDNKNIKDIDLYIIRNNILYISQQEKLFTGTIKENILLERSVSNTLFQKICTLCEIESIVKDRYMQYESFIESNNNNLSEGEKQRIVLARGLLKNASILILDEVLSETDLKLEEKIIKNICTYFHDKTIIYISHKNVAKNFTKVIKINN